MVRKKIDNRIRIMIENGVAERHRSLFVIVGDHGRDQVVILHHMLSKAAIKARPSVLWCYKKELGFSSHRKKRMRQLQKKIKSGKLDVKEDDPFELFVAATNIRYTYYSETHKILGNTFGMCVLQDFEALTPNLLARTVETVEGGGLVVLLLRTMTSLRQLYTMTMDVHARFRTESHQDVVGRFNERFLLSLASCKRCMVIDDQLNVLPVSSHTLQIQPVPPKTSDDPLPPSEQELKELKESLQDTQPVGVLVDSCKTLDQAKAVLKFVEAISEKTLRSTVSLTAARGRGKSAALGLAIAAAVGFGYSNIFVTSPSPENLKTVFEFVFKGFDSLEYQEHLDYELVQSTNPEFNNAIVRVNIFREHRQTIQYIHPGDAHKLGQAELVCIDEAAAIPLPLVKNLLGPYLVFMASTVNGYEGTGRSLSLKLLQQLRQQNVTFGKQATDQQKGAPGGLASATGRILHEISLTESIRYGDGDAVEQWLNEVLCLDASNVQRISSGCPVPENCDLYYVNRDTLFSYHKASEAFLQRIMGLYVASHYKNTPNDLQMLSDAPAHHIFVLLGPVDPTQNTLPEVLCVLQVCLEGEISKSNIMNSLSRGKRASGDLIPWTISQQFQDHDFPQLSGGRVVRIATHPDYQGMGYGTRALEILQHYYEGKIPSLVEDAVVEEAVPTVSKDAVGLLEERIAPRKNLPPLLLKLSERPAEKLDYLGVSYGLTAGLLKFWKRSGFIPVYLRQTPNDLTGEHSCIMLKVLNEGEKTEQEEESWLMAFWKDFRRRFLSLLSYQFRTFHPSLSLSILQQKQCKEKESVISAEELDNYFTKYDLKRLELYSQNMVDYHLIMDLLPSIARLHFLNKTGVHISAVQAAILVSMGLQHKSVEDVEKDMEVPSSQLLGLFNRVIRKMVQQFNQIAEEAVEKDMVARKEVIMEPVKNSLDQELGEAAAEVAKKQKKDLELLKDADLSQYTIKGSEGDWENALTKGTKGLLSVKSGVQEKRKSVDSTSFEQQTPGKHKKHKKQKHHKH
ncbi:RNA cytidine acetyltransferase-like isoform X1 [Lingula anatina]|uniref:RNA cytidine acetyltransferase n=2 Tax=Lingula anatina TaxID=7574 RepID=A0A2R2MQ86_LINAN|nr:RNA cytidine acetyltransferase-like isoform X1 [Lingula anatina]|eukprot:XP_023932401.1 RNA cytidine acetyltransferase-like isoform X1 [Lingula anatina]